MLDFKILSCNIMLGKKKKLQKWIREINNLLFGKEWVDICSLISLMERLIPKKIISLNLQRFQWKLISITIWKFNQVEAQKYDNSNNASPWSFRIYLKKGINRNNNIISTYLILVYYYFCEVKIIQVLKMGFIFKGMFTTNSYFLNPIDVDLHICSKFLKHEWS